MEMAKTNLDGLALAIGGRGVLAEVFIPNKEAQKRSFM
jgi:hypothetical protein